MSGREDISGVVGGAPALLDVYIVAVPDGLLVRSWQRSGERDGDAAAAHVGQLLGAASELLLAVAASGTADLITVESGDRVVLIAGLGRGLVTALVFDRAAPLGLVRIEARELVERIRGSLSASRTRESQPPGRARLASVPPPEPSHGVSAIVSSQLPGRSESRAAVAPAIVPSTSSLPRAPADQPRVARLIEALREGSADLHTALLRVSLRTGIPIEMLERPETLGSEQVDAVAGAVRDMLGHNPLS